VGRRIRLYKMKCNWFNNHISLDSIGTVRPCCAWRATGDEPQVYELINYKNSDFYNKIKEQFNNDIWPTGCKDCELEEAEGQSSMRLETKLRDAEVKFGNVCNLSCAMCSPTNSSLIDTEYSQMRDKGYTHPLINRTASVFNKWYEDEEQLDQVAQFLSDRQLIRFTGGEPTVNTYLQNFLDCLSRYNTSIIIYITTNGNNWPSRLNEVLERFDRKKISISLDGYGDINEYIRYPSKWNKIQDNITKIKELNNCSISVGTTVGCYNVHLQTELAEWCVSNNFNQVFNPVWGPEILQPCHASDIAKNKFIELSQWYEPARRILPSINMQGLGLTPAIEFFTLLDKHRNTDIGVLQLHE